MKFPVVFLAAIFLCTSATKISLLDNIKGSTIKTAILGMQFPSIKGYPNGKVLESYLVENLKINDFDLTAADLTIEENEFTLTLGNVKLIVSADVEAGSKIFGRQKMSATITSNTESAALGLTHSKARGFKVPKCAISMSSMDIAFDGIAEGIFKSGIEFMASKFTAKMLGIDGAGTMLCPMVEKLINGFLVEHIKENYPGLAQSLLA